MRTKQKSLFVLCAVCLCCMGMLTGCHGTKERRAFEMPEELDTSRRLEITFWAKNDTNKLQTEVYEEAITDFEKLYPNIHVNMRLYTDYGKIYNDVITNISTDTTPNVCITYPDHIATYVTGSNSVVALDDLFADEKYGLGGSSVRFDAPTKEEIVSEFLEECAFGDVHYAMPYMRSTEACYVNKTYVEALGYELPEVLTWDFVWEVSEAAMQKNADGTFAINGQELMIPFIYKSTDNMMIQMLKQKEAGYSTEQGEILIFNDTTKALLSTVAEHAASGAFSTFKISSYPANFLNAGQCIFAVDSTAGATWMGSYAPLSDISEEKFVEFETVVLPVPQFDTDNLQMISQGPSVCIFNKEDEQEVLASWLFAQYLLTDKVQIAYAETEGYVPVTTTARQSEEYLDYFRRKGEDNETHYSVKLQASELLLENTENTFVTPVFNGSASLRNAAGQMIENVTKSVRRKETIDDAYMEELFAEMTALYRLNEDAKGLHAMEKSEFGPLPKTAVILLLSLGIVWVVLGIYAAMDIYKKIRKEQFNDRH